jgi:hypothetical protein
MNDSWQSDSRKRLLSFTLAAPDRNRDYAPDTSYEQLKLGKCGPHTVCIADILKRWADMWAQDMREDRAEGGNYDADKAWADCMHLADGEVDRYLAANNLARAA